ncbi:MAG TPA: aminoacyl-tRNA hydrolase [Longimicrobiaceae bacterium]|nr:aminoacyl-tRNA hydrolase [Longimicrobiaceae bacterium]
MGLFGLFRREPEDARVVAGLKVVLGLGNPGPEYAATRHNVGWWLLDALAESWSLGRFKKEKESAVAAGRVDPFSVRLVKPLTYMNLSGRVLAPYRRMNAFDVRRDLLVVVDDVALPPGRIRFRPEGSAGGHNGLKSVEAALGTREYPRLRIGVGGPPPGADLARWVLSPVPAAERQAVLDLFPGLVEGAATWMNEGIEAAMNRFNG